MQTGKIQGAAVIKRKVGSRYRMPAADFMSALLRIQCQHAAVLVDLFSNHRMLVDNPAFFQNNIQQSLKILERMETGLSLQLNGPAGPQRKRNMVLPLTWKPDPAISLELLFKLLQRLLIPLICVEISRFACEATGQLQFFCGLHHPLQCLVVGLIVEPCCFFSEVLD
ncbi:hypothetical protein D3C73_715490 [compost metagenome]